MHNQVVIIFDTHHRLDLPAESAIESSQSAAARIWFDHNWEQLGCEPMRISGKVLLLDKILGVTDALGYAKLANDADLAREFAYHVTQAVGKSYVTIDLPGLSVAF